jgi:acyl transferase domain-containing protein
MSVSLHRPRIRMVSSVTGSMVADEVTDVGYWLNHSLNTCNYMKAVLTSVSVFVPDALIEISIDNELSTYATDIFQKSNYNDILCVCSMELAQHMEDSE